MSLSVSQSAMAFQKAQDQKIDQHQQPNMDLGGGGVKINYHDTIVPRFESLMCERTEVHSFMNDVTAFD